MTLLPMPTGQRKLLIAFGLVGLAVTTWLLLRTDVRALASSLDQIAALHSVGLLVGATLANLGLRFVRFQYFLRRAELRRPERDSLRIFLGSLGFGFIPLLAGEIAFKAAALGQGDRRSVRSGALVAIHERVCDVAALSAIAALDPWLRAGGSARDVLGSGLWLPPLLFLVPSVRRAVIGAAHAVVSIAMRLFGMSVPFDTGEPPAALVSTRASAIGLVLGLLAWGVLCITTALVAGLLAPSVEGGHTAPLFAKATLLGSASLSPGGIGVTGVLLSHGLVASGAALPAAVAVVILVRGTTFWLTLALGQLVLILSARTSSPASESHFDALSPEYDAQVPAHIRDLLVERKTRRMLERLPGSRELRGLDIGCGLGRHMRAMQSSGARVAGIDLSSAQAREASKGDGPIVRASAVGLPFASGSFDFAYSVNVVHHLASRDQQLRAFEEIARVLKPGGLFFLHEINVVNPLFRFYMGYVFPLIRRIDEGTELWIDPSAPPVPASLRRVAVQYFTFVPDFLPHRLLRTALWLEARLERSWLARYSAHFLLILERAP